LPDQEPLTGEFKPAKFTADSIRGRLRESLAEGIYQDVESSFHVLRELVQNGVDAIKDYRKAHDPHFEGEIRIRTSATSIEVFDTGLGMSRDELKEVVSFGATSKDPEFHVGFRGIGFWANSTLASKVILISKKRGERYKRALMVDVDGWKKEEATLSLLQLLNKYVFEDKPSPDDTRSGYPLIRRTV
jgi:Histidine kinase-, DNA gyrase B-, and HSP90-like ATPase